MLAEKTGKVQVVSVFEVLDQRIYRKTIRPDGGGGIKGGRVMVAVRAGR